MKKFKYLLVGGLLACTTVASTACNFGPGDSDEEDLGSRIEIILETDGGGLGTEWVTAAGKRFEKTVADKQYGNYTGVKISAKAGSGVTLSGAASDGTAIYDLSAVDSVKTAATSVLDLTDLVTSTLEKDSRGQDVSIEDKIDTSERGRYQYDGKYLALPSIEYYPSISYDVNLFDNYGLYFASGETENAWECEILDQTYYFTANASEKACGPDGQTGTSDDGLPTSLYEFIALCDYMKSGGKGIHPINFTGAYSYYSDFMLTALTYSLLGWEKAQATFSFNCSEMEIVTGFTNDNLFPGSDIAKKPTTQKVAITEENGYLTTWSVEKYYAEAFFDLCLEKGWFGPSVASGDDQVAAMRKFIYSDKSSRDQKIGMHIDGSFWYNEATLKGVIDSYNAAVGENMGQGLKGERKVALMSLPVSFDETVTEENELGRGQVFVDMWRSMLVVNANVVNTPGKKEATLDFLKFLYTDAELANYTALTSVRKSLNYTVPDAQYNNMPYYGKELLNMLNDENNHVLHFEGGNETFAGAPSEFVTVNWNTNGIFMYGGKNYYKYRKDNSTVYAAEIFKGQSIKQSKWKSIYKGSLSAAALTEALATFPAEIA